MKTVMIGAHKPNTLVPGGFRRPRKRKSNFTREIVSAAKEFLAGRIARDKNVHP